MILRPTIVSYLIVCCGDIFYFVIYIYGVGIVIVTLTVILTVILKGEKVEDGEY